MPCSCCRDWCWSSVSVGFHCQGPDLMERCQAAFSLLCVGEMQTFLGSPGRAVQRGGQLGDGKTPPTLENGFGVGVWLTCATREHRKEASGFLHIVLNSVISVVWGTSIVFFSRRMGHQSQRRQSRQTALGEQLPCFKIPLRWPYAFH